MKKMYSDLCRNSRFRGAQILIVGLLFALPSLAWAEVSPATEIQTPRADSRTIQGIVVDEAGNSLNGASVSLRGTRMGTSTDPSGRFTLRVPASGDVVLDVEYLGYEKKMVAVGLSSDYRIVLVESAIVTSDVIVTGLATIDKNDYVGAVTVVDADKIRIAGESSIDQMLQGVVPGMSVINSTGKVGGTPKIRIRGTSTLLGNQEPLWVVDGVVQRDPNPPIDPTSPIAQDMESLLETAGNAISWLNPADIENIYVLKDASATAIYGSQASNGVIVVTTKKATGQGLSVSYSGEYTVGQRPRYSHYDLMNSQQLMQFAQEMFVDRDQYSGVLDPVGYAGLLEKWWKGEVSQEEYEREFHKMEMQNTDWFEALFRNSFSHRHNVSIMGGGENVQSRFSLGMDRQSGEARGNDLNGLTAASSTTYRASEKVIVDLQLNGSYRETKDFAFGVSPYDYAMTTARTIPLYNEDGSLFYHDKLGNSSFSVDNPYINGVQSKTYYKYNILNELDNTGAEMKALNVNAALNITVKILEGLDFRGTASYSLSSSRQKSWATEFSNYITGRYRRYEYGEVLPGSIEEAHSPLPQGGLLQSGNTMGNDYSMRANLNYNRTFNDRHRVLLQLGFEASSYTMEAFNTMRFGYRYYRGETFSSINSREALEALAPIPNIDFNGIPDLNDEMRRGTSVVDTKDNKISEYFTAIYGFNERYILNFNARLDASNRFGQDQNKKFNPSWSLGAKWRIGNEPWMAWSQNWMNMMDLSVSYGYRGNAVQQVSPYLITTMGWNEEWQRDILTIRSLAYPNLGWEKKRDWNASLDFSFLENRITAVFNYYGSKAEVLSSYPVPVENGVATAMIAGTEIRNNGWDLGVNFVPIRNQDWTWSLSFNAGKNNNKVENNKIKVDYNSYIAGTSVVDGERYGTFYAYKYAGLDPTNGRPMIDKVTVNPLETPTENDLDFLVKAGCLEPDFSGGLNSTLRYKNWTLSTMFAVSLGAQRFLPSIYPGSVVPTPAENASVQLLDRWRKPGDENWTDIPSVPPGRLADLQMALPVAVTAERTGAQANLYSMYDHSDIRVADTDFIRCRNISLRYDLPDNIINKLYARRISVAASMTNPFVIVFDKDWQGRDPETGGWPARRTMSFSLNLTF